MPIEPTVLVIDGSDAPRAALTHRIRKMGYRAMRAKTPEEAFAIVEEHRHRVTAALIPPHLAVADLGAALESLAARAPQGRLSYVVVGACPGEESLAELREAGLRLALWEPIDDARLRFQVNRALAGFGTQEASRAEIVRDDGERGFALRFRNLGAPAEHYLAKMVGSLPVLEEGDGDGGGLVVSEIIDPE